MRIGRNYLKSLGAIAALLLMLCLGSAPATACTLKFEPTNENLLPGETVDIDVFFSPHGGTLVRTFDLFVNYNPDFLTLDPSNVRFGVGLGGEPMLQSATQTVEGKANIAELSIIPDLSTLQTGTEDLYLFSMTFTADQLGKSPLTFSGNIAPNESFLIDSEENIIDLDNIGTASINVVPIPGSGWLMLFGLAGLYRAKRRIK